jgi:uncharacterized protein (DUF2141 family)
MKKILFIMCGIIILLKANETYNLTISVKELKNSIGVVQYSIYNKEDGIPDENFKNLYLQSSSSIINGNSIMVFENIPKDIYAVNILHDENKNKQIDKGLMLPTEGVGLSNYKTINFFNRPNFKNASFILDKDKQIDIKVNYF